MRDTSLIHMFKGTLPQLIAVITGKFLFLIKITIFYVVGIVPQLIKKNLFISVKQLTNYKDYCNFFFNY